MRFFILLGFILIFFAALTTDVKSQEYSIPQPVDPDIYDAPVRPVEVNDSDYVYRGLYVSVELAEDYFADVSFYNIIVPRGVATDITFTDIDGLVVYVHLEHGNGDIPDIITVTPPPGFVAIPQQLSVEEGSTGVIEIHAHLLG